MNRFKNFIQIAGVVDNTEAKMLLDCGIKYLGFPLRLPVNKEDISESGAGKIIKSLIPPNYGIVITYLNKADEIISFCSELNSNIVQLHGNIDVSELKKLKITSPKLIVIKSLIVGKYNLNELKSQIELQSEFIDAFITDTYNPVTGATGATGKLHDWEISKAIVEYSSKPVILAGGLTDKNIYDAIIKVKPAGVDAHTGVENSEGAKDRVKVEKFYLEAMKAFEEINSENGENVA